jgi:hypothetical protein
MADLFPFRDVPGLLSPEQTGNVKSNALLSAAAALLKSGGYSPVPVSPLSQLGQGLEGFLSGYKGGNDDALKQELLRGQIMQRHLMMAKFGLEARGLGIDPSSFLPSSLTPGAPSAGATPQPQPAGPAPGGPAPSTLVGRNPQIAAGGPPPGGLPAGLFSPQPTALTPPPSLATANPAPAPAPGAAPAMPGGAASVLRGIPMSDRMLLLGGDKVADTVGKITAKNAENTVDQKNAASSGMASPFAYNVGVKNAEKTPDQKAAEQAGFQDVPSYTAHLKAEEARGGAIGKRMADVIDAGGSHARNTLNNLNVMEDAIARGGDKIFTGPFAEEAQKLKQAYTNITGEKLDGLQESEVVGKLNAFLAGEATKQISSRPAQFEFQTYLKNNPGLATSIEGTKKLINIMRQTTQQNIKLGRLAMKAKPSELGRR